MGTEPHPKSVTLAMLAMVAVSALSAIEMVFELINWEWTNPLFDSLFVAISLGFILGYLALTHFVSRGRRWARMIAMVLSAVSLLLLPLFIREFLPTDVFEWGSLMGYAALDLAILYLLLSRSTREWFALPSQAQAVF